jgi:predicted phosphodiesterase
LYAIGDVHIGAAACNEKLLRQTVKRIEADDNARWVGVGDYCEWINQKDPRFSAGTLAKWIDIDDLVDLAKAQRDHFLGIVRPIASKCLALVCGNHETALQRHFERDVYSEIVSGVKESGGFDADHKLAVGFYGWLILKFYRSKTRHRSTTIKINLHHGFVGGRLAGAKALNMQRWLWTHDADLVIFGHSHNTASQIEQVESVDKSGKLVQRIRRGVYAGTYLETVSVDGPPSYSEVKGYFPTPTGSPEIVLRPGAKDIRDAIRVVL